MPVVTRQVLSSQPVGGKRILAVDDNDTNRRILGETRSWGMMVQTTSPGKR
jgi:hypothetical protein